ncbi:glutamate dehydrogenase, partial [Oligoflexaceae bacterium]|nr:glutamate dehydrogenase [Oligoflexaceae bacterium]
VQTLSDSDGTIEFSEGMNDKHLSFLHELKEEKRGRVSEAADKFADVTFHKGKKPWRLDCDVALPCATQNEFVADDAKAAAANSVFAVLEGANMPVTHEAAAILKSKGVILVPGKAANAGGVAVSGLEMSQNAQRLSWSKQEVEERLKDIMKSIHKKCVEKADDLETLDYVAGANIAGFEKVADAMLSYGAV